MKTLRKNQEEELNRWSSAIGWVLAARTSSKVNFHDHNLRQQQLSRRAEPYYPWRKDYLPNDV